MQVVGDDLGIHFEKALHPRDRILKRLEGVEIFKVADMRPEIRLGADTDAERILELRSARQHGTAERSRERDRAWHVTARAAHHGGSAGKHAYDGVVASGHDLAVVQNEQVGDRAEPRDCLVVAIGDGFLGQIARGHHERAADFSQYQVMQRRVRKHQPEHRIIGRDFGWRVRRRRAAGRERSAARWRRRIGRFGLGKIRQALAPRRDRAPSRRAAFARGVCGCEGAAPRRNWSHRRRGETRQYP